MAVHRLLLVCFGILLLFVFAECIVPATYDNSGYSSCRNVRCHPNARCLWYPEYNSYRCRCSGNLLGNGVEFCGRSRNPFYGLLLRQCTLTCHPYGSCTLDYFTRLPVCNCKEGYYRQNGNRCAKVKTCLYPTYCDRHARCIPRPFGIGYDCKCRHDFGYYGDGRICVLRRRLRYTPRFARGH